MSDEPNGVRTPTNGTTLDDVRRHNLRQVLRLAHQDGPLSRAELTRATGLNRSTIAGLVVDLQERGLVDERAATPTRRVGRPSPRVGASESTMVIAVNPEVDSIDLALVALNGKVRRRVLYKNERIPSVTEFVNVASAIIRGLEPIDPRVRVLGIGLALPGLVREFDGTVILAPHLHWQNEPVAELLQAATGLPVVAGNDANCGVIAESTFGAGRGSGVVVYLNGGASGIGSGIVIDGHLITGQSGHAGEFGHTLVNSLGASCQCGAQGCLEAEVRRDRFMEAAQLDDSNPELVPGSLRRAWRTPDSASGVEMRRQVRHLAVALRTIIHSLNPRRVVLGGYLSQMLAVVGEAELKRALAPMLASGMLDLTIVATKLADEILLIGAAELAFAPLLEDPTSIPPQPHVHT